MRNVIFHRIFLMFGLVLIATVAAAKEWYFQPITKLNSEYNDNPLLRSENIQDAYGVFTNLGAEYGVRSELYTISSTSLLDIYRYWDRKELNLDRENFYTDINSSYAFSERNKLGFNASYLQDTTLTSELQTTGIVQNQVSRKSISISPNWNYLIAATKTLKANYNHEDITFDSNFNNLLGYEVDSGSLGYYEQWTPKTQYFVSTSALRFHVKNSENTTNNISLNVGFEHQYSETTKFNFMIGGRDTEIKNTNILNQSDSSNSLGWLLAIDLEKLFEVGNFNLRYSRSISPTAVGLLIQSDHFSGNVQYKFSERFKAILSASAIMTSSTSSDKRYDRSYYSIEPKLAWELTRQTSLAGGYHYQSQSYDLGGSGATSNTVFVNLNYQWDKFATRHEPQFLENMIARIQGTAEPTMESLAAETPSPSQESLRVAFFTRPEVGQLARAYSDRFRNALYFHYSKYIARRT